MTVDFVQGVYKVNEVVGIVKVCVSVLASDALDGEVAVQYGTRDQSAVGMDFVCVSMI